MPPDLQFHDDNPVLTSAAERLSRNYVENGPMPHLQMLVSVDERVVLDHVSGEARADGEPLQRDALFRIASMTKPLVTAAFLTLVEAGRVSLETPLATIIPEFSEMRLWDGNVDKDGQPTHGNRVERPITLYDLLRHSAGFSYSIHRASALDAIYGALQLDNFQHKRTAAEYASQIAALPLLYPPGERFHYSIATDLLGVVIERVAGEGLDAFLADTLLDPLGMIDTAFVVSADKQDRLVDAWMLDETGAPTVYDRGEQSRWRVEPKFFSAGGGLVSTAADYHRFLRMLMHGGEREGRQILAPGTVALMLRNHLPGGGDLVAERSVPLSETSLPGIGMGLGGAIVLDSTETQAPGSPGTYLWGGMLSTGFFLDPARRIIGLIMTQLMPSGSTELREDFRRAVYGALPPSSGNAPKCRMT
ncbi:MAG: serine hydrolase domain-containing protein [Sphingobium sp.]